MPPLNGQLSPSGRLRLQQNLAGLFNHAGMSELLLSLDKDMADYVSPVAIRKDAANAIIDGANMEGWWRQLANAMRRERREAPDLLIFAEEFGLALPASAWQGGVETPVQGQALQDILRPGNPLLDMTVFREKMAEVEMCVCRIECPVGRPRATGFLVGPDVVMTNYHVVKKLISTELSAAERWKPEDVCVRFDFKLLPNGVSVSEGTALGLSKTDWLVDFSPYSKHDIESEPTGEPAEDELDYALLRLATAAGALPVSDKIANSPLRKWIEVPPTAVIPDFSSQKALLIVQHPDGSPMRLAIDMDAVLGVQGNGTRLRYRTNTMKGSSGSPCFDADWNWIALHHSGDPKYELRFNQGILLSSIVALLEKRGKRDVLGGTL